MKLWLVKKVGRKRKNILPSREDIFTIRKSANNPDDYYNYYSYYMI